jgi:hypothetical protein
VEELVDPVLLCAPPTREIVETRGTVGVEKVNVVDVPVPAESVDIAA